MSIRDPECEINVVNGCHVFSHKATFTHLLKNHKVMVVFHFRSLPPASQYMQFLKLVKVRAAA